jgi:hypothetical protein
LGLDSAVEAFDGVVAGLPGDEVIVGLTGAKKISNLSPANPIRIIYGPIPLPTFPLTREGRGAYRDVCKHGEVAIVLVRCICLKGAVTIWD